MKLTSSNFPVIDTRGIEIDFEDFGVSWIGRDATSGLLHLGSEDGRVRRISNEDSSRQSTFKFDTLSEPINSIALNGAWISASTRCEVIFLNLHKREGGSQTKIYDGGAHGVLGTSAGGFVAPLGTNGCLLMKPVSTYDMSVTISKPTFGSVNFFKLDRLALASDVESDFFAVAGRQSGLAGLEILSGDVRNRTSEGRLFQAPGLDVVDVCSINSHSWPRAVAGLGADGSIHFCKDLFGDELPREVRLKNLQGSAYSILGDRDHLLIFTSSHLYAFPNLARDFLDDKVRTGRIDSRVLPLEATDIYKSSDELFILLPDRVVVCSFNEIMTKVVEPIGNPVSLVQESPQIRWDSTAHFVSTEAPAAVA